VRTQVKLQPIIYQNTKAIKTHDLLPLNLVSQRATFTIVAEHFSAEFFVFFPWFMMISALTHTEQSTKTRCGLLETASWVLLVDHALSVNGSISPDLHFRTPEPGWAPLYRRNQLVHALNSLYCIIMTLRTLPTPLCLNKIGTNPLEHLFGRGRLRRRDVNVFQKFVTVLGSDFLSMTSNVIPDLVSIPRHRTVLGVNCETYDPSLPSMFKYEPMETAVFVVKLAHLTVEKVYRASTTPRLVFRCQSTNPQPLLDGEMASEQGSDRQERASGDEVCETENFANRSLFSICFYPSHTPSALIPED
jgi:hypothetical protein